MTRTDREALEQALDRMERVWNLLHPGDLTEDERHGMAHNLWMGMEEIKAALGLPSWFSDKAEP